MPVSSMKKLKNGKEEYELLEESFIIPMSSTAAAASADEECWGFCPFTALKLRAYLQHRKHDAARNE